ncbi:MAG: CopG family transcriptional regulator [Chloroflexota bacterium]
MPDPDFIGWRDTRSRPPSDPRLRTPVGRSEALDAMVVTMYTYTVDRTQIYLTPEESAALERASIETGKTKSQLIREAIDEKYRPRPSLEEFMAALNAATGAWKEEPGEDRSAYLRDLRRASLEKQRYLRRLWREEPARDR